MPHLNFYCSCEHFSHSNPPLPHSPQVPSCSTTHTGGACNVLHAAPTCSLSFPHGLLLFFVLIFPLSSLYFALTIQDPREFVSPENLVQHRSARARGGLVGSIDKLTERLQIFKTRISAGRWRLFEHPRLHDSTTPRVERGNILGNRSMTTQGSCFRQSRLADDVLIDTRRLLSSLLTPT